MFSNNSIFLILNLVFNKSIYSLEFLLNINNSFNKDKIFQIATQISTPLGLAGLSIFVSYLVYRLLFRNNILSKICQTDTFKIIDKIISYLFILSIILSIFGFSGFIVEKFVIVNQSRLLSPNMIFGIDMMQYDSKNHIFRALPRIKYLNETYKNSLNLYLGINKYDNTTDKLNQVYNISGSFNLRETMDEQHIIFDKNMTNFLKNGGEIRVCYFLVNKLFSINTEKFIPSEYSNLKESCGKYYFHELKDNDS